MPHCRLHTLAETGEAFASFAPYVPAMGADGRVAFQASGADGSSSVFFADRAEAISGSSSVLSHPALSEASHSWYSSEGLRIGEALVPIPVGPLGPTMNGQGSVAYRSQGCVSMHAAGAVQHVAGPEQGFSDFEGLPVVNGREEIVFHGLRRGVAGIYRWRAGGLTLLVSGLPGLGRFPSIDERGRVGFCTAAGFFIAEEGEIRSLPTRFASHRGILLGPDTPILLATPSGGSLGIYVQGERLLGLGDRYQGKRILDFALNPVSINARGAFAIRLGFADGEAIVAAY